MRQHTIKRWLPAGLVLIIFAGLAFGAATSYSRERGQAPGGTVHQVALLADHAEPTALIVKLGESVQFNSRDGKPHNIGQGGGNENGKDHEHPRGVLESGRFGADEAYRLRFGQTGSYDFHDHLNPHIFVTVVVYDPERR
ncbi:hypothetical protein KY386_01430 [Candidatus Parcubacteria bacterium]|nr:hypothetical protein [Candidatus Parcubacteria bacterium]